MNRKLLLTLLMLGWYAIADFGEANLWAQLDSASQLKANQKSKRATGSAPTLRGTTKVIHIFCFDDESGWTRDERADVLRRSRQALDFIERQSRERGISTSFYEHVGRDVRLNGLIPTKSQVNHAWTEQSIRKSVGRTGSKMVQHIQDAEGMDNVLFCLHVNKQALSYNLAFYDSVSDVYGAERMVCFACYPDGRNTAAATYAHEVLHLFGAGDLYFPFDQDSARKERAAKLFPDDVMFRVDYDLTRLNIGAYTAYRIGWTNELDPEFEIFDD